MPRGAHVTSAAGSALARRSAEVRRERSAAVERIVRATRAAQGLPPTVEDNAVLDLVATHLEQAAQGVPDEAA